MNVPSEKAQSFAEEALDFVHRGLSRADAAREIAEMFDEANRELVQSARAVIGESANQNGDRNPQGLKELKSALHRYEALQLTSAPQTDILTQSATQRPTAN